MHIDERKVDGSLDIPVKVNRDENENGLSMKNPKTSEDAAAEAAAAATSAPSTTETIATFSDSDDSRWIGTSDIAKCSTINEKSMNDRIVYATIDRLALKRTRLPLQLVPMEDVSEKRDEKKEKINVDKRSNGNRKTSPRRPSFKVRPGIPTSSGQWKSRAVRSTPRSDRNPGNFENVSKRLVSRLVIFENIIRDNNNRNYCGRFDDGQTFVADAITNGQVPGPRIPETQASSEERSNVIHSKSFRDSRNKEEIVADDAGSERGHSTISLKHKDPSDTDSRANRPDEFNLDDSKTKVETATRQSTLFASDESPEKNENNDESYEPQGNNVFASQKHEFESCSTSATNVANTSSLLVNKNHHKSKIAPAKNSVNYETIPPSSNNSKSEKISNNCWKNRKNYGKMNFQCSKNQNISRDELRDSISFPTNFVHLASATNSKLLPDGDGTSIKSRNVITHEEKRAKLRYIGINGNYQEIEIAKAVEEIMRNSENKETTTYVEIEKGIPLSFTETRRSGCLDETSVDSTSTLSSSSSSSSSLPSCDNEKDVDGNANRAKVRSLENSQGVPEVVKTSENEGTNVDHAANPEDEDATVPDYEPMSEFLSNTRIAHATTPAAATTRANASFLWRTRGPRYSVDKTTSDGSNYDKITLMACETGAKTDNSIDDVGYDTYDDVGLSRDDTEEDHYDDVGFPSMDKKNSSTDTLFEDIDDGENGELYDDVVVGPVNDNSSPETRTTRSNDNNRSTGTIKSTSSRQSGEISKTIDSSCANGLENVERDDRENEYFSISNDYSSVEEDLDDFAGQEDDGLYDDVELPSQERVNSLYAGSSSGSQLGSLYNGKESEWEDLEEAAPVLPLPKKNNVASRHGDSQVAANKKKVVQRWSRKVRQQKSKASRKNSASRSTSRGAVSRGTSTISDTASDDSNYETVFSVDSDEFSSESDNDDDDNSLANPASANVDDTVLQNRVNGIYGEAPSRPVPPPPRESSLTETLGKQMKMLRRTWSITKGSLGRIRRRTSSTVDHETIVDDVGKYQNCDQQNSNSDGKKYFGFKKHFKKSMTGLSTFYLDNENRDETLSRNNNCSKEEVNSDCSNSSWYTNTDYWKNSVTEQSERNDVDHYSMLDEEPLYQFYAAAAARVAFESDSEGYEEVEDPTPSPSTVDLARPGHRTLWCQTPQVMSSGLLQRLTPEVKKMQEAKFEIFTSEASYLNSLRVLVDEFLNDYELIHEVLTTSERDKLFGGVPGVLIASERLLAEMETVWREDPMLKGLPEVLLNYAQRSASVYVAYCSNQVSIDTTLNELKNKKGSKFVDTVKRIETHPACQSLSLHSFLMLPMQRVTRLPLLAEAVLSKVTSDNKEERTCWECVWSQLSQVVMECNEGARAAGRLAEMEALERKLEYSSKVPPIILRDRYLVRRGPVVQMLAKPDAEYKLTFGKKHHKNPLYLLLLTDYLLIAKLKSNTNEETYTIIDSCKRSLVALEKVTDESPFAGRNAMVLTLLENYSGRHVEYIVTCQNPTERERWLDAVTPPKPNLVGESLYETWDCPQVIARFPYAAAQPDELTLQPGDVINVLRKMTDGWYLGEKLLAGEQGWFPGNYAKEVASEHVRARNLRQRHRLLALSASVLQRRAKQTSRLH